MGQGNGSLVPYTAPPVSSANALDKVPAGDIYVPQQGVPPGSMNGNAINNLLPGADGGLFSHNPSGFNPDVAKWLNQRFPGANVPTAPWNPSNGDLQKQIGGVRKQVDDSQQQLTNLQHAVDDNQNDNESKYGFQTIANATQATWNYNSSVTFFNPVENMLVNAAAGGAIIMSQVLWRLKTSTNFLVWLNFCEASQGFPDVEDLNAAVATDKPLGMSDLAFLQMKLPAYAWEENHENTGMVGMSAQSAGDGIIRSYYWSPPCVSADAINALIVDAVIEAENNIVNRIFHLWDYTPSSGGPQRNGITDTMQIAALLPVQY